MSNASSKPESFELSPLDEETLAQVAGGRTVPTDAEQLEYDTIMDLIYWTAN